MSRVADAEVSMGKSLLDMPDEILFEIFRSLPKGKLDELSRLCSKFRGIVGDARLWKDVYIEYGPRNGVFAFEELFSGPWPVKEVDLNRTQIKPPVFPRTDQVVKVKKLNLSCSKASKVTMQAIFDKYQCTELDLDLEHADHIWMGITPEAFSKQTSLEVLSIFGGYQNIELRPNLILWLAEVLSNCKSLKFLNLRHFCFNNDDMLGIVKSLPISLEKLSVKTTGFLDYEFYHLLAKSTPNLRELELCPLIMDCSALPEFQFLETIHLRYKKCINVNDICMYIMKLPAVKTVYMFQNGSRDPSAKFEEYRMILEPHGITVRLHEKDELYRYLEAPKDGTLWRVTSAV